MAWFKYEDQPIRKYRKGIWLRVRSLPEELLATINENMKKGEDIAWVMIEEVRPGGEVLLEVWCYQPRSRKYKIERYSVFHLLVRENPQWTCESDLGRGLVLPKEKPKPAATEGS